MRSAVRRSIGHWTSAHGWATLAWVLTILLGFLPVLSDGRLRDAVWLVIPGAAAAATLTVRVWLRALALPVEHAYRLGYMAGAGDATRAVADCPNVFNLTPHPRRPAS